MICVVSFPRITARRSTPFYLKINSPKFPNFHADT